MKRLFLLCLTALCLSWGLHGQASITLRDGTLKKLTQAQQDSIVFIYPTFQDGKVLFRSGQQTSAELNYNCYSQQLLFKQKNDKGVMDILRVTNMADLLMVQIGEKTFMPIGNALAEILIDDNISLLSSRKVSNSEKKTGAYGTGGNTASISNLTSYDAGASVSQGRGMDGGSETHGGAGYSAGLDRSSFGPNSTLSVDTRLFLMKDMKAVPLTAKNLKKIFPKSSDFIKQYMEKNKPDLENESDMIPFIGLCIDNEKNK